MAGWYWEASLTRVSEVNSGPVILVDGPGLAKVAFTLGNKAKYQYTLMTDEVKERRKLEAGSSSGGCSRRRQLVRVIAFYFENGAAVVIGTATKSFL